MNTSPNFLKPSSFEDMQKQYTFFKKRYEEFYHHTVPSRYMHIIGDSLLVILILFFGSYAGISYVQQKFFTPASAKLSIILPGDIITVGMSTKFLVRYENNTRAPLYDARLTFQFHPLFTSATSSKFIINPETHILEIGTIEASEEKEFVLSGIPFGAREDVQTISAELTFKSNKKEGREHIASFVRYIIQKGDVQHTACTAPSTVTFYQVFNYECTLSNNIDKPLERIITEFISPSSYTDRSDKTNSEYSLSSHEEKNISLMGFFQKQAVGRQKIIARTYLLLQDKKYLQDETELPIRVISPVLSVNVLYDPLIPFIPGKTYPFTLHWKNEDKKNISDVRIRVFAHGDYIKDKEITSFIKSAHSSQEGDITFSLTLDKKNESKKELSDHVFTIMLEPSASYTDQTQQTIKVFSIPAQLDISSGISLQAFARYYTADGEQIGRGPLPPKAGKTTRYQIFFAPKKGIHDIKDFTISAQLGSHTSWTGIVPFGFDALRYYPEKKNLIYAIPLLPSVFSASDEPFGAVFELALTPAPEDIGKSALLVERIRASGQDAITRMPLEFTHQNITTDLISDPKAKSMGMIVK